MGNTTVFNLTLTLDDCTTFGTEPRYGEGERERERERGGNGRWKKEKEGGRRREGGIEEGEGEKGI